jgi:hypothetical protein
MDAPPMRSLRPQDGPLHPYQGCRRPTTPVLFISPGAEIAKAPGTTPPTCVEGTVRVYGDPADRVIVATAIGEFLITRRAVT